MTTQLHAAWDGLTLEQHLRIPSVTDLPPLTSHIVCLNLGAPCTLRQERDGQARKRRHPLGDASFMPAGQPSRWHWETPANLLHLFVEPELMQRVALEMGRDTLPEMVSSFGASDLRLLHLGLALKAEAETGGGNGLLFAESLSTAVAAHLLTQYGAAPATGPASPHGLSASQLKRVADHIKGHLHADLSIAEIAETVHVSPSHFARQFKRATGKTLHQFVLECRLNAAQRLLRRPDLSVGQVASQAGFAQQSHLAAHFRRITGLSPAGFRRQVLSLAKAHESAQNAQEFD